MTPNHSEHDRDRGGAGDHDSMREPWEPGVDWSRVVAIVVALIVLAIVTILLSTLR